MRTHKARLAGASLAAVASLALTTSAMAFGALAINSKHGSAYGWANAQPSPGAAERVALGNCGADCHIVLRFSSGCGAYAADQAEGGSAYGWGTSDFRGRAESIALSECRRHGGQRCVVRVHACE